MAIVLTPFDEEIAEKVKWFKENYRFIWKTIQSAPSELSFKIFMMSDVREDHVKKLVEEINYYFARKYIGALAYFLLRMLLQKCDDYHGNNT